MAVANKNTTTNGIGGRVVSVISEWFRDWNPPKFKLVSCEPEATPSDPEFNATRSCGTRHFRNIGSFSLPRDNR